MRRQRGFLPLPLIGSFLLSNWKIIVIGLAVAAVAYYIHDCQSTKREFATYKADVVAKGEAFKREQEKLAAYRMQLSDRREAEHAIQVATLEDRYSTAVAGAKRLSRDNASLNGRVRALSEAASKFNCGDGQADLAGRLERLEVGVLGLLKRGDQAITRTITCKAWVLDQLGVPGAGGPAP